MNSLQKALFINAIFSGISGLTLIIFDSSISRIFGFEKDGIFQITGVVLIAFTATIVYQIIKLRSLVVLWIIIQDFLWVIGSILLLILEPFYISGSGHISIQLVALAVLVMGINQSIALAQVDNISGNGDKRFMFERTVKASKEDVWKVISDVENYYIVAPNIDHVKIISGEGQGMVRSCSNGKDTWTESCSLWIEEDIYSFEVDTSAPDYPYPFVFLKGTWGVRVIESDMTKIVMIFDFRYRHKIQNVLLHPILKGKFKSISEELLDNWQGMLENGLG